MATPIRWDTVRGPSLAEAAAPLQQAQRSILSGFGDLGNVLAQREAMDQANYQNTRINNTNAFLDAVAKYRTPEELKAAQDSGALDALRASFNGQVDAGAIRGAADARTAALQQQAQNRIAYEHMQTDERVAPLLDQFKRATLAGDSVAAAAAQRQYEQLGGRDLAGLASYADQRGQQMVERGRATTNFDNQQTLFKDNLLTSSAQRQHLANQDAAALLRAQLDKEQMAFTREDRAALRSSQAFKVNQAAIDAAYENVVKNSPLDKGTLNTAEGKEQFLKGLKDMGISKTQQEDILYNFSKRFSKGAVVGVDSKNNSVLSDVPVSVALDAVAGATENPLSAITPGWSRRGDDAANIVSNRMLTDKSLQRAIAAVEEANLARRNPNRVAEFRQALSGSGKSGGGNSSSTSTKVPGYLDMPSKAMLEQAGRMRGNRIEDDDR